MMLALLVSTHNVNSFIEQKPSSWTKWERNTSIVRMILQMPETISRKPYHGYFHNRFLNHQLQLLSQIVRLIFCAGYIFLIIASHCIRQHKIMTYRLGTLSHHMHHFLPDEVVCMISILVLSIVLNNSGIEVRRKR